MSYGMASPTKTGAAMMGTKTPKGYHSGRLQNFTPEQMQLFQKLFSQVSPESFTSKLAGGDQSAFGQMEAPALRQFSGLQGNIASRFSGMGMGGRKSSGFQNTMNSAASDFAQNLQSQRMGYQQQALKDLMSMSGELLEQRPYQNILTKGGEKKSSGFGGLIGGALGGLGGFFAGGPGGALSGAKLGYGIGSGF